jgi:hypothetical protein
MTTLTNEPYYTASTIVLQLPGGSIPAVAEYVGEWVTVSTLDEYPPEWGEGRTLHEATDDVIATMRENLVEFTEVEATLSGHMRRWLAALRRLFPDGR